MDPILPSLQRIIRQSRLKEEIHLDKNDWIQIIKELELLRNSDNEGLVALLDTIIPVMIDNITKDTLEEMAYNLSAIADNIELLATAMDKYEQAPLYVSNINGNPKLDINNCIVASDIPNGVLSLTRSYNGTHFVLDTTGYQSLVIICGTMSASITIFTSNDGVNWSTANFIHNATQGIVNSISASSTIAHIPCYGRYLRGVGSSTLTCNYTLVLRNSPVTGFAALGGVPQNLFTIAGTTPVTAGVAGTLATGGNIAPGSARTANPLPIGGTDSSNLTRVIRTDTTGRIQLSPVSSSGNTILDINNNPTLSVSDLTQTENLTTGELLTLILTELRIQTLLLQDLPMMLNNGKDYEIDYEQLQEETYKTIN